MAGERPPEAWDGDGPLEPTLDASPERHPIGGYVPPRRPGRWARLGPGLEWLPAALTVVVALFLAGQALQPGVGFWDTGEFQTVGPVLGTAHPTGFPAYVLLGWLASIVLQPLGEPAVRMNALSAVLVAVAAGGLAILVRQLAGRPWLGAAAGLVLAMSPVAWRIAGRADAHALHLALVAALLVALVGWEERRRARRPGADRWLMAAAALYGVALANHTLALLLAPGIGLFVLVVEPRIVRRPGFVARCAVVLVAVTGLLYLELPVRAAMHAPLVYGRPDTLDGFRYVVLAEQFRGSLVDPLGHLGDKLTTVLDALSGQLGDLVPLAGLGFVLTVLRRPRYALLSGVSFVVTVWFAASYVNAEIDRYYLGPVLLALSWLAVGAGLLLDLVEVAVGLRPPTRAALLPWIASPRADDGASRAAGPEMAARLRGWPFELALAAVLLVPAVSAAPDRLDLLRTVPPTDAQRWLDVTLAALPQRAVVVSWWSYSTPLWYAQRAEGRRPDIWIVDDRTRLDEGLGGLDDVIDAQLGRRPVYLIRPGAEIVDLGSRYRLETVSAVAGLDPLVRVDGRLGSSR
ncbi:MAG TPA: DUF2723 domain-containing protein [Candidatus Limnocylindrales bacterium]